MMIRNSRGGFESEYELERFNKAVADIEAAHGGVTKRWPDTPAPRLAAPVAAQAVAGRKHAAARAAQLSGLVRLSAPFLSTPMPVHPARPKRPKQRSGRRQT
jgi:hypothetical protein